MSISKQKSFAYRPNFQWRFWLRSGILELLWLCSAVYHIYDIGKKLNQTIYKMRLLTKVDTLLNMYYLVSSLIWTCNGMDVQITFIFSLGHNAKPRFWKFVFFEKATRFDEIFILLLTNKFFFLRFPPNFEFSVSYSSSLSGAPWDPSENYLILKSSKVGFC